MLINVWRARQPELLIVLTNASIYEALFLIFNTQPHKQIINKQMTQTTNKTKKKQTDSSYLGLGWLKGLNCLSFEEKWQTFPFPRGDAESERFEKLKSKNGKMCQILPNY